MSSDVLTPFTIFEVDLSLGRGERRKRALFNELKKMSSAELETWLSCTEAHDFMFNDNEVFPADLENIVEDCIDILEECCCEPLLKGQDAEKGGRCAEVLKRTKPTGAHAPIKSSVLSIESQRSLGPGCIEEGSK